ncbi:unnamed protein product [Agarophyton chilense]|eukprot:gb/GEZJ01005891.1/.p1 GENE.gb/GEZJ01005891.1/~~gb/GEZJ01005891.1/.p1  ORF type:complete len:542 (-),score=56.16 gb/GEZJ01005891.1/:514-2139(-)
MRQISVPFSAPSRLGATNPISLCTPTADDNAAHLFHKHPPSAPDPLDCNHPTPSWQYIRHQILSLATLQLLHDASSRHIVENHFSSEELMLDSPSVLSSISILNSMHTNAAIVTKVHALLTDVLDDFFVLEGWRVEQIGDHLTGYLRGQNSLQNVERMVRLVLLGNHNELPALDRELDRIRAVVAVRWQPTQLSNRAQVDKLKHMLLASGAADIVLDDLIQSSQSTALSIPAIHAISIIAAMECGYRPTAEKYILDLYNAIKPNVERGRLLMTPLIPRWLRDAMVPIFVRHLDTAVDGLLTGDRWLHRVGADCRSADYYPIYASHSESPPPGRVIPYMPADHIDFKPDSYLSKFLRALFSGRDGGACRTLHTYMAYSARTCCVPQGRVVAGVWERACMSWANRYGPKLVDNIERIVGVRGLAAIYAGGGGFVEFRNGFCERILSGVFTREFELSTAGGRLSGSPGIDGSYRIAAEGNLDRRDMEVLATLINAVESRGVVIDLKGVKRVPFLYGSVNFVLEGKRTGVYEMWCKQRIQVSFPK